MTKMTPATEALQMSVEAQQFRDSDQKCVDENLHKFNEQIIQHAISGFYSIRAYIKLPEYRPEHIDRQIIAMVIKSLQDAGYSTKIPSGWDATLIVTWGGPPKQRRWWQFFR